MKKFAAIIHTKQLIRQSGFHNVTTTLTSAEHLAKIEELADRAYGPIGDKNIDSNSQINKEEREMIDEYNEYIEDRMEKNSQKWIHRMKEISERRKKENEEEMKNNTLLRQMKKLWTLTSYERKLQEFSDEDKRFKFRVERGDLEECTPAPVFYYDQPAEPRPTVLV